MDYDFKDKLNIFQGKHLNRKMGKKCSVAFASRKQVRKIQLFQIFNQP